MGGKQTVLFLSYLIGGGNIAGRLFLNIPKMILAPFTEPKGMGKNRAVAAKTESPQALVVRCSLNIFCAKLTAEVWVFILCKCPYTSALFLCGPENNYFSVVEQKNSHTGSYQHSI